MRKDLRYPIHNSPEFNESGCMDMYGCILLYLDIISMIKYQYLIAEGLLINDFLMFLKSCSPPLCFYYIKINFKKNISDIKFVLNSFSIPNDQIYLSIRAFDILSIFFLIFKNLLVSIDLNATFIN